MKTVVVSGASVAGTAAAYWLGRHGYSVTMVERHPGLRPGGQAIDVRGPALDVLERMGLLAAAQEHKTRIRGASFVDRDGNELFRDTESTPTGGPVNSPDIELLRDDLVELLYGATQPSVEYLFDDSISTLQDDGDSVRVTFERAAAREFDLVIGADGLHSNVRRLVFGPEEQFVKRLGTHAAIFTVPNFLELDYWQTWHYGDSTMAGVYSARNNTEARAALAFMDTELRIDYRDTEAQFAELQRRMAEDGWVRAQLLHYMRSAPDFYFDEMSQILMDRWSRGRVALIAARPCRGRGPASPCWVPTSWPANSRRPVTTTNSDSPITTPNFTALSSATNGWSATTSPVVRRYRRRSSNESCIPSRSRTTERLHPGAARMALVGRFTEPEDLQTKYE